MKKLKKIWQNKKNMASGIVIGIFIGWLIWGREE
jgi:F0F1-type ATP synthase assembly protein I